jgi:hypothetical protein
VRQILQLRIVLNEESRPHPATSRTVSEISIISDNVLILRQLSPTVFETLRLIRYTQTRGVHEDFTASILEENKCCLKKYVDIYLRSDTYCLPTIINYFICFSSARLFMFTTLFARTFAFLTRTIFLQRILYNIARP